MITDVTRLLLKATLVAVILSWGATPSAAQDEAWIYLTINGEPTGGQPAALVDSPTLLTESGLSWIRSMSDGLRRLLRWRPSLPVAEATGPVLRSRLQPPSIPEWLPTRSLAVTDRSSSFYTIPLRCSGGATSGNPDADIRVWVDIYVDCTKLGGHHDAAASPYGLS